MLKAGPILLIERCVALEARSSGSTGDLRELTHQGFGSVGHLGDPDIGRKSTVFTKLLQSFDAGSPDMVDFETDSEHSNLVVSLLSRIRS